MEYPVEELYPIVLEAAVWRTHPPTLRQPGSALLSAWLLPLPSRNFSPP